MFFYRPHVILCGWLHFKIQFLTSFSSNYSFAIISPSPPLPSHFPSFHTFTAVLSLSAGELSDRLGAGNLSAILSLNVIVSLASGLHLQSQTMKQTVLVASCIVVISFLQIAVHISVSVSCWTAVGK